MGARKEGARKGRELEEKGKGGSEEEREREGRESSEREGREAR